MASFQNIVMIVATIILILSLCFIGLGLYRQKYRSDYPPVIANCPDYWLDVSGNGAECNMDTNNPIGTCTGPMDFTQATWAGQSGGCSKYKWAKGCGVTWDGITNNPDLCAGGGT
jgi:hypothetical protein